MRSNIGFAWLLLLPAPLAVARDTQTTDSPIAPTRALDVAYRLASRGHARCKIGAPLVGAGWQVIEQFAPTDRAAAAASLHLDRGPRVTAIARGSPAELAGLAPGDTVLAVDGRSLAPPAEQARPDQAARLAAIDRIDTNVSAAAAAGLATLTVLRDGTERTLSLRAAIGCPLHLYVARSNQRNAYADGVHLLIPTGLIDRIGNDDELALLIAHEMAHNILGHAARLAAASRRDRDAVLRAEEDEADALGVDLAIDAGYDVVRGSRVFLLGGGGIDLSPSHRSGKRRVELALERVRQRAIGAVHTR